MQKYFTKKENQKYFGSLGEAQFSEGWFDLYFDSSHPVESSNLS